MRKINPFKVNFDQVVVVGITMLVTTFSYLNSSHLGNYTVDRVSYDALITNLKFSRDLNELLRMMFSLNGSVEPGAISSFYLLSSLTSLHFYNAILTFILAYLVLSYLKDISRFVLYFGALTLIFGFYEFVIFEITLRFKTALIVLIALIRIKRELSIQVIFLSAMFHFSIVLLFLLKLTYSLISLNRYKFSLQHKILYLVGAIFFLVALLILYTALNQSISLTELENFISNKSNYLSHIPDVFKIFLFSFLICCILSLTILIIGNVKFTRLEVTCLTIFILAGVFMFVPYRGILVLYISLVLMLGDDRIWSKNLVAFCCMILSTYSIYKGFYNEQNLFLRIVN